MKTQRVFILSCLLMLAAVSCAEKKKNGSKEVMTGFSLDDRLQAADSLVVVFYNNPYGPDSLRYTRFYKQVSLTDTHHIVALKEQSGNSFEGPVERRNCRSEGKIWCFNDGKVFQTLYFATSCDACCFVYLIKDGNFYYTRTTTFFVSWLNSIKPLATEPVTE
jgi:hypothetical protein